MFRVLFTTHINTLIQVPKYVPLIVVNTIFFSRTEYCKSHPLCKGCYTLNKAWTFSSFWCSMGTNYCKHAVTTQRPLYYSPRDGRATWVCDHVRHWCYSKEVTKGTPEFDTFKTSLIVVVQTSSNFQSAWICLDFGFALQIIFNTVTDIYVLILRFPFTDTES